MSNKTLQLTVALLFILSGITGLIYQIVWFKYLSLFLGNTTHAQTVVLATFMGGLAIGAWLWGRRADVAKQPLLVYACLELGIGVYCLFYPAFIGFLREAFISLVHATNLPSDSVTVLAMKFVLSLLTLLLPTVLMGGTLPVLVKALSRSLEDAGKNVAVLYFLNSFGAVLGSAIGGFAFVPILGLRASMFMTATVNLAIGLGALFLNQRVSRTTASGSETAPEAEQVFAGREMSVALVVAGVSGMAAMLYEIGWVRLLIPILGSSTYSFSLMLIAFITGIALGSWIVSHFIIRVKNLFAFLAVCQAGVALALCATLPIYGRLPYYFVHLGKILQRSEATYPLFLTLEFVFCFAVMVVPTIFMGMTLPVASRIATRSLSVLGKAIGSVFSINTWGTVLGSILAGLVLIPAVGIKHTIEVGIGLNVLMVLLVLFFGTSMPPKVRLAGTFALFAVTALSLLITPNWSRSVSLSGVFRLINRNAPAPKSYSSFSGMFTRQKLLYYREGRSATVAVVEDRDPAGRPQQVLVVNGKADASSSGDLPTQTLVGQLPMLFHPKPDSVFVIGLGSGITLGSVLAHDVKWVECAEISPEVVEASKFFHAVSHRPLADPRTRLHVDDALAFLKLTPRRYHVIVSEPTNPWIAGIGNLYTTEFLQQCKQRLTADGLMVQWFHLYEMDDETARLAFRTFRSVFPYMTVWQSLTTDFIVMGAKQPIAFDPAAIKAKLEAERVQASLSRIQITDVPTLLSLQIMTEEALDQYVGPGALNTEDRPLLEYRAPRAFFVNRGNLAFFTYDERMSFRNNELFLTQYLAQTPVTAEEWSRIGVLHATFPRGNITYGYSLLAAHHAAHADSVAALEKLAAAAEFLGRQEECLRYRQRLAKLKPNDAATLERYAWQRFTYDMPRASSTVGYDGSEIEALLKRSIACAADTVDRLRVRLGDFYYKTLRFAEAEENYRKALSIREIHTPDPGASQDDLLLRLSRALYHAGQADQALTYAAQAWLENPENEQVRTFFLYLRSINNGTNH
ncbi:fused MFS/spermidine synthase [candidate division KSB1 bacterium]|nr:fused MFS/spermidine synthase [candidate division KSB1 bacterium]